MGLGVVWNAGLGAWYMVHLSLVLGHRAAMLSYHPKTTCPRVISYDRTFSGYKAAVL